MGDIVKQFSKIIYYLEKLNTYNIHDVSIENAIKEQKENLEDLEVVFSEFERYFLQFESGESIHHRRNDSDARRYDSDKTLDKLLKIHKYTNDLEWHISEINEINGKMMKICSAKRE